jgi:hypothetical protein
MPIKSTVPEGNECGRRERESRREGRREQSLRDEESFAWRGGERHPGLQEGGTLRGVSSECGPRSVRRLLRVSSRGSWRADDSGCPEDAEEGNAVGMRDLCACTQHRHERSLHALRGRVLRSVLRPVRVNPHYAPRRKLRRWGVRAKHHGWVNSGNREEPALGLSRADVARLAACRRSRKGEGATRREKEGDRGLRPCED